MTDLTTDTGTYGAVPYDADVATRKLRAAGSAAAVAINYGVSPAAILAAVLDGIRESMWMNTRQPGERRPATPLPDQVRAPRHAAADVAATAPVLAAWAAEVNAA